MKKIHIVTDSTADLIEEDTDQYGIHIVPLTIQIEGETYLDGVDIQPDTFHGKDEESKNCQKVHNLLLVFSKNYMIASVRMAVKSFRSI